MVQKTRSKSKKAPSWASSRVRKRTLKKAKKERREMIKLPAAMSAMESTSRN